MEKDEDHLPPSCNNQGIDLNLSLGGESNKSTNLTQGANSMESSSSKNSTVVPEELQLRLGNSITHGERQESQNSTNLTQCANSMESSSKTSTVLPEELQLRLGANSIESSSKNSTVLPEELQLGLGNSVTHREGQESKNSTTFTQLWRTVSLPKELEFEVAVLHAKKRERRQEQFADYDQDNSNLNSAKMAAVFFQIGSWKLVSKRREDLVAKIYYKSKKLIWKFLIGTRKKKIEILWSNISAINTLVTKDGKFVLVIELHFEPQFFQEINYVEKKKTRWGPSHDFTDNQASLYRQHTIVFEAGVLDGPLADLLRCDSQLRECSQDPFPRHRSTFFDST